MIVLVTGAPGSGKSYYAVRTIATALMDGKPVATNIALKEGWERQVANLNPLNRILWWRRRRVEERLGRQVFVSDDLDELFRVRLDGDKEGRGVMVLDEAHTWLNSRTWDQSADARATKAEAVAQRLKMVRYFSSHRHLGFDVYCITQDELNIDRQVRGLFEYHVRLKNLRNFKLAGIRIVPVRYFLAIWEWNDTAKSIVKRQGYPLTRIANIYSTHALAVADDLLGDQDAIRLPALPVEVCEPEDASEDSRPPIPVTAAVPDHAA